MAEKRQEVADSCDDIKDFKNAVNYLEMYRKIAREEGGRANAYHGLGDFEKAIENHNRDLKMSKELGYRAGERKAYGNLGNAYYSLGDFQKAIEYQQRRLKISISSFSLDFAASRS